MGQLGPKFTILSELASQDDLRRLLGKVSPTLVSELDSCFKTTMATSQVEQLEWPEDRDLHAVFSPTSHIADRHYE